MELLKLCDFDSRMFADSSLVIENIVYIGQTDSIDFGRQWFNVQWFSNFNSKEQFVDIEACWIPSLIHLFFFDKKCILFFGIKFDDGNSNPFYMFIANSAVDWCVFPIGSSKCLI